MKKISLLFIVLIFSFCSSTKPGNETKADKLALIIAIADYPETGGWTKISSANDVEIIKKALLKQGFNEKDITVIVDDEAKKDDIEKAIKNLTNRAQEGNTVLIHYSGHGQQIMDNENKDEIDGYDEALIPYDAHKIYNKKKYTGSAHLRDDEFGILLTELRQKLGKSGDLFVTIDACHSGTSTRGYAKCRGTNIKFQPTGYKPRQNKGNDKGFYEQQFKSRGDNTINNLAPVVVVSASGQNELNYEYTDAKGESYGSLSYTLASALSSCKSTFTYRALFDIIKNKMANLAPNQTPQLEGNIDREILGGKAVEQTHYYTVKEWIDNKTLVTDAGHLAGIYDHTKVALYPLNTLTPNKTKQIATGEIVNSGLIESDVVLDRAVKKEEAANAWIFITEKNITHNRTRVMLDIPSGNTYYEALNNKLSDLKTIKITRKYPDIIIEQSGAEKIVVKSMNNDVYYKNKIDKSNLNHVSNDILETIRTYVQAQLLRNLDAIDKNLNVTFEINPITVKKIGRRYVEDKRLDITSKMINGNLVFNDGDCFKIKVINKGKQPAYFQILDIAPDNNINLLIPNRFKTPDEYIIYPRDTLEIRDIFIFSEPFGKEMFKLIATEQPLHLPGIISNKGNISRGTLHEIEQILANSYMQTRSDPLNVPPASANIYTIIVDVR